VDECKPLVMELGAGKASVPTDPKQLRRVLGRAAHPSTHLNLSRFA